VRASARFRRRT